MAPVSFPLNEQQNEQPLSQDKRLLRNITFFGDSAIPEDSPIYRSVWDSAKLLAENGYTIVNGGGPGIMKAATDGAESINGNTIAIYWQPKLASFFEGRNLANVTDEYETCSNYMMRTLGLIEKGDAYVVCKGGTGTISEFGMVWALAKLYYGCHKPVILYGKFWDKIIETIQTEMNIDEKELAVLYQAEHPADLLQILQQHELKIQHCKKRSVNGDESAFILTDRHKLTAQAYNFEASNYHSDHAGKLVSQEQLDEFISLVNPPAQVLDLGTGFGYDAKYLSEKYVVTGIEISPKSAQIAKFENPDIEIIVGDMLTYDFGQNKFKGIWARNSIHHIEGRYLPDLFKKVYGALVDDGIFYMIVREGDGEGVEVDQRNYQKIEKFFHYFSEDEIRYLAEEAGFKLEKIKRVTRSHNWLNAILRKTT